MQPVKKKLNLDQPLDEMTQDGFDEFLDSVPPPEETAEDYMKVVSPERHEKVGYLLLRLLLLQERVSFQIFNRQGLNEIRDFMPASVLKEVTKRPKPRTDKPKAPYKRIEKIPTHMVCKPVGRDESSNSNKCFVFSGTSSQGDQEAGTEDYHSTGTHHCDCSA
jgi:hypothetical protein